MFMINPLQVDQLTEKKDNGPQLSAEDLLMTQEMAELGMFYGLSKGKTHPRMRPFIYSTRGGVEIIDLEKTIKALKEAVSFLKETHSASKQILFIGVSPAAKTAIKEIAEKLSQPFIIKRWPGGTLTNFKVIAARVEVLKKLSSDKEAGNLAKYTKKERLMIDRQIEKMENLFGSIKNLKEPPGALFVIDPVKNKTAVREAKRIRIPVVAVLNTNADPDLIDYPIPANDRNLRSIAWILNYLASHLQSKKSEN